MVACMFRIFAAAATPWAWLPEENATTPPPRAFCGIDDSLLKAPRNLNEPVRCSISGFRKTLVPTRSLRTGNDNSGVRTANGATTRAAASISAETMAGCCRGHLPGHLSILNEDRNFSLRAFLPFGLTLVATAMMTQVQRFDATAIPFPANFGPSKE